MCACDNPCSVPSPLPLPPPPPPPPPSLSLLPPSTPSSNCPPPPSPPSSGNYYYSPPLLSRPSYSSPSTAEQRYRWVIPFSVQKITQKGKESLLIICSFIVVGRRSYETSSLILEKCYVHNNFFQHFFTTFQNDVILEQKNKKQKNPKFDTLSANSWVKLKYQIGCTRSAISFAATSVDSVLQLSSATIPSPLRQLLLLCTAALPALLLLPSAAERRYRRVIPSSVQKLPYAAPPNPIVPYFPFYYFSPPPSAMSDPVKLTTCSVIYATITLLSSFLFLL